jgi:hypothetical protein
MHGKGRGLINRPCSPDRRKLMKPWKAFVGALLAVAAFGSLGGCREAKYVAKPNEELYGVWQNESMGAKKVAIASDGYKVYSHPIDVEPLSAGTIQITSKWTDAKGNLWYKAYQTVTAGTEGLKGAKSQVLYQVGRSGEVLEAVDTAVQEFSPTAFPSNLDPKSSSYAMYHRWTDYSPRGVLIGDMWTDASPRRVLAGDMWTEADTR